MKSIPAYYIEEDVLYIVMYRTLQGVYQGLGIGLLQKPTNRPHDYCFGIVLDSVSTDEVIGLPSITYGREWVARYFIE